MAFALIATFPLGTYRAHVGDGGSDLLPAPARLHAALLNAAAQGTRAEVEAAGGVMYPSASDREALDWMERNPPDGLAIPGYQRAQHHHWRYRRTGTLPLEPNNKDGLWKLKLSRGRPESCVALSGSVAFVWEKSLPSSVAQALAELAGDVSHLGTAESPIWLRAGEAEPTHRLDRDANLWDPQGVDLDIALPGRGEALVSAYRAANGPPPSANGDRHGRDDVLRPPPRVSAGVATARYARVAAIEPPGAPWPLVLLLPLDRRIDPDWRLRWATAVHRRLVALVGPDAPSLVTGHHGDTGPVAANHLAIQFLEPMWASQHLTDAPSTLALMIPGNADPAALEVLREAVDELSVIQGPGGVRAKISGDRTTVDATAFWDPPPVGATRTWRTVPLAIPDTRPPRGRAWSFADAALLSVGLTWRDQLSAPGKGWAWMTELSASAGAKGVQVVSARRVLRSDLRTQVHRVSEHAVISAYEAELELGALADPRTLAAIGQTRHLGGGLLVPVSRAAT